MARDNYPDHYPKLCNKWWEGYQGQKNVIMDDIDPDLAKCLKQHIKLWGDGYTVVLEVKGGAVKDNYLNFIVTSQYSIRECFTDEKYYQAIKRRFKEIHLVFPYAGKKSAD